MTDSPKATQSRESTSFNAAYECERMADRLRAAIDETDDMVVRDELLGVLGDMESLAQDVGTAEQKVSEILEWAERDNPPEGAKTSSME